MTFDLTKTFAMQRPPEPVDFTEVTKKAREVVDKVDRANAPKEPTDDMLRAEWSTLEQSYRELTHYAAQSEQSTNVQADHVRMVQKRLKAVEDLIPEDIREETLTKFQAGQRVYRHIEACRGILALREVYKDATELFTRKRKISADWSARKAAFEADKLPRLLQLREVVKQQDTNLAIARGRKSVWQY